MLVDNLLPPPQLYILFAISVTLASVFADRDNIIGFGLSTMCILLSMMHIAVWCIVNLTQSKGLAVFYIGLHLFVLNLVGVAISAWIVSTIRKKIDQVTSSDP